MSAAAIPDVKALRVARSRRIRAQVLVVLVLAFLVVGLWAASLMFGESFYGPSEVWRVIAGERVPGASFTVGTLRLPRATLAVLAGLAFGSKTTDRLQSVNHQKQTHCLCLLISAFQFVKDRCVQYCYLLRKSK